MSKATRWAKRVRQSTSETLGDLCSFTTGYRQFKRDGTTPPEAYMSMRRLFRKSNGHFNDLMGGLCKAFHPKRRIDLKTSIFDDVTQSEVRAVARSIRRDGFHVFDRKLSTVACDRLLDFSLSHAAVSTTACSASGSTSKSIFDRNNPQSIRHQFQANDLFQNETVQEVSTDPFFFSIAQEYLGFNPVFDVLAMWWSAPTKDANLQSKAAQQYHFDMDRLKFVKFFVYLTDVNSQTGPHCYIRGSHKRKPASLLKDERLSDDEVRQHYRRSDFVELTGSVGTMLAVDTRGFHKGKPLTQDDRLILQIQYADSLFGQNYPLIHVPSVLAPPVAQRIATNRRCFANFSKIENL